jgi:membrane dipeptidase
MPFLIDSHEDLAYNVLAFGRDYRRSVVETRELERNTTVPANTGETLIGWPEHQLGQVAIVFGTLFIVPRKYAEKEFQAQSFQDFREAHTLYRSQIDVYRQWSDANPEMYRLVSSRKDLQDIITPWELSPSSYPKNTHPTGIVMSIEGAEGLRDPQELEEWWEAGVRIVGPVWAGTRYCGGSMEPGKFSKEGFELLEVMADLGYVLDISHMTEISALQAIDYYDGIIIASHANARALLREDPRDRQLTDTVIRSLIERGGTIGVLPYNRFLDSDWHPGSSRDNIKLEMLTEHIDHICQIAGDALHVGIGTDFDGGFGLSSVPAEIDNISDVQKLEPILLKKGYEPEDVAAIFGTNWHRFLKIALPEN